MLSLKKWMAKVNDQLNMVPQIKSWSGIATPKASTYYPCCTFTLKPKSKYLILGVNGNGQGDSVRCTCNFLISSGTAKTSILAAGISNDTSGNNAIGWAYVETGSTSVNLQVRGYGYDTSVTALNGKAIAIRLFGGVLRNPLIARLTAISKIGGGVNA